MYFERRCKFTLVAFVRLLLLVCHHVNVPLTLIGEYIGTLDALKRLLLAINRNWLTVFMVFFLYSLGLLLFDLGHREKSSQI